MSSKYTEYQFGELNVILSVPHGGQCRPKSIPNRDAGSCVDGKLVYDHRLPKDASVPVRIKNDLFTVQLAGSLAEALERYAGKRPHVVINRLHRVKVDCNSGIEEGTFGVPKSLAAWKSYHATIEAAKSAVGGRGLLLDIHGHSHAENWIELGYGIGRDKLNCAAFEPRDTTIGRLYEEHKTSGRDVDACNLVQGSDSLGGLLERSGYKVVPSPAYPIPGDGNYFSGGYSVLFHGSKRGGRFDAIQIESPFELRSSASARRRYADSLGRAVAEYLRLHYTA